MNTSLEKPKVVLTRKWPAIVEEKIQALFDVRLNEFDRPMTTEELRAALRSADALCPTVSDDINSRVLDAEPMSTKIIGNYGVGFNHIDLEAAKKANLVVTNTPDALTDCTADIAIALMLMVARRLGEGERQLRDKNWHGWYPTHMMGSKVTGKTLGLIGMGRIAQAVAYRAYHGFNMKIVYYNPSSIAEEIQNELNAEPLSSIDEVLGCADFVSLHCPGGDATHHLIDAESLALMRPGSSLINTARGSVVDEVALVAALESGSIGGAGMDVYENEPAIQEKLLNMENVVLLPHLGSASSETRIAMGMRVVDNLQAFFSGQEPPDCVV